MAEIDLSRYVTRKWSGRRNTPRLWVEADFTPTGRVICYYICGEFDTGKRVYKRWMALHAREYHVAVFPSACVWARIDSILRDFELAARTWRALS